MTDLPKRSLQAAALALGFLVCLAGCGVSQFTRGDLEPPRVALKSLGAGLPTGQGLPLECALEVTNPNAREFRVLGYDYELRLDGRQVALGESREEVTLPARGQALVHVPILVKLKALRQLLPVVLSGKQVEYRVSGGVRLASLLGGLRVPFSFQGRVTLQEGMKQMRHFLQ